MATETTYSLTPQKPRRRRTVWIVLFVVVALPLLGGMAYLAWRSSPPAGAPRIGLSMASSFVLQRPFYEDALARAGGRAVLITPTDDNARLKKMLDGVDAILLSGGDDVDPALYGGDPDDAGSISTSRDEFEIKLIRAALERDLPVLGICRGIQILNVAHGGTLRNLRDEPGFSERHGIDMDSFTAHSVLVAEGSRLATAIGAGEHKVNSFHGQAVDKVGNGLRICATATDGVVEGIELPDRDYVIGIQWHPEIASLTNAKALNLIRALVERAERFRAQRAKCPGCAERGE